MTKRTMVINVLDNQRSDKKNKRVSLLIRDKGNVPDTDENHHKNTNSGETKRDPE